MSERKIEIQMAVVNADQTAADISKSTAAVAGLTESTRKSSEEAKKFGDETDKASDHSKSARLKEVGAAAAAIGAAAKVAGQALSQVREQIENVNLDRLNDIDPNIADEFKKIAEWSAAAQDPVNALIDATHRLFSGETVAEAFARMNDALARGQEQHGHHIDNMIAMGIRQTGELRRLADEVKNANSILNASDKADAAARDRADAEAKRNGADPFEIAKARADFDAQQEISRIKRERETKSAAAWAAQDNADTAVANVGKLQIDPLASRADINRAKEAADAQKRAAADAWNESKTADEVAKQRIREVKERQEARKEDAAGGQAQREIDIRAKHAEDNDRLERAEEARQLAGRVDSSGRSLDASARTAAGKFGIAAGRSNDSGLARNLDRIRGSLDDGTDAEEMKRLQEQLQNATKGMGGATIAALKEMLNELTKQAKEVSILKEQIKSSRTGR